MVLLLLTALVEVEQLDARVAVHVVGGAGARLEAAHPLLKGDDVADDAVAVVGLDGGGEVGPGDGARVDAVEVAVDVAQGHGLGDARDLEDEAGDALDRGPVDGGHGAEVGREDAEVLGAGDDGGQPLLAVPDAVAGDGAGDLADADDGGGDASAAGGLVEDEGADELGAAVARARQGEVEQAGLGDGAGAGPGVDGADAADEDDGHVLGGAQGEVDPVADAADVRLERLDRDVEVDGPGVVDDAVGVAEEAVVDLGREPQGALGQVGAEELGLGPGGREAAVGAHLGLARRAVLAAVEADDPGHGRVGLEEVEEVGAQGAGGSRDEHGLVAIRGRGLVGGAGDDRVLGQVAGVFGQLGLHGVDVVVLAVVVAVAVGGRGRGGVHAVHEVSCQLAGRRVGVDDPGGDGVGGDAGAGGLEPLAEETGGVDDLHGVDARAEEVRVGRQRAAAEGLLEEALDGVDHGLLGGDVDVHRQRVGAVLGLVVPGVDLVLVELQGHGPLDRALAGAREGLVRAGDADEGAADLAVGDGLLVGLDDEGPDVVDEGVNRLDRLEDEEGLEAHGAGDDGAPDARVARDDLLDGDGVKLLAIGEDNDVVGAAVVGPVVGQGRVLAVQVLGVVLAGVGEGVENALEGVIGLLANEDLLVDVVVLAAGRAPVDAQAVRVDDEPLPEVGVLLEEVRQGCGPVKQVYILSKVTWLVDWQKGWWMGNGDILGKGNDAGHGDALLDQLVAGFARQVAAAKVDALETPQRGDALGHVAHLLEDGGGQDDVVDGRMLDGVDDGLGRQGPVGEAEGDGAAPVDSGEGGHVAAGGVEEGHGQEQAGAVHDGFDAVFRAHEVVKVVEGVGDGQHAGAGDDGLRQAGAAASVQDDDGVVLGLVKGLVVGEVWHLVVGQPGVSRTNHDGIHLALFKQGLDDVLEGSIEADDVAVGLLKQVHLALEGVARGDEQGLVAGLDAGDGDDHVARIVGADVGEGREGAGRGGASLVDDAPGYPVDGVGDLLKGDGPPAVSGVGGARDGEELGVGFRPRGVVDDLGDQTPSVLGLCHAEMEVVL
ncbi:hypothetical protein ColKHC_05915 [Colletotrichum higginsianum]|nr:hypothetical protein ColKHC_05915 [Colletotrichum higginsianum]